MMGFHTVGRTAKKKKKKNQEAAAQTRVLTQRIQTYGKAHTQNIYYLCLNPTKKPCTDVPINVRIQIIFGLQTIQGWEEYHQILIPHLPRHPLPAPSEDTGEQILWAYPMCLTINSHPHKQKYLLIGIIRPAFFQKMYPTQLRPPLMKSALIWQGSFKGVAPPIRLTPIRHAINPCKASFHMSCLIIYAHSYRINSNLLPS